MITPNGNRLHIGIFGSCNAGKSTLINALVGQDVAIVSDIAGTTTDAVYKAMEIKELGAVTLIDTAGYDDNTQLSEARLKVTNLAMVKTDIALLVIRGAITDVDIAFLNKLNSLEIATIIVHNTENVESWAVDARFDNKQIFVNARAKIGIETLVGAITKVAEKQSNDMSITAGYVSSGDTVILVMPQDGSAPSGRLILPQAQTIRELLDKGCTAICVTPQGYEECLNKLNTLPKLIITDSQVFDYVYKRTPKVLPLTSFSVLFARQKGDIAVYLEGAKAIEGLGSKSKVLIAEACSHAPQEEDIGRVKIPAMLKAKYGVTDFVICAGADYPDDLSSFDLIIHCGGCMFNRRHVLSRIDRAVAQNVPITNYGIAIAKLKGILDKILIMD